jgi:S1-C subfamily serine protease
MTTSQRRAGGLRAAVAGLSVLVCGSAFAADESPLPQTIDRIRHSIVAVGTNEPTRNPSFGFRGTGFVVGDGSLVATNNHVIAADVDATKREMFVIAIPLAGGEALLREASVVGRDVEHDIAVLKVSGPPLPALRLGDSSRVREGDAVAFTGFPIGGVIGLFPATHRGLVSAITPVALTQANARSLDAGMIRMLRQERFPIFQLDATAYPGNSGSPLFDMATGDVLAIVNSTLVKAGKESAMTQPSGISYAVPSKYLTQLLESIKGRSN